MSRCDENRGAECCPLCGFGWHGLPGNGTSVPLGCPGVYGSEDAQQFYIQHGYGRGYGGPTSPAQFFAKFEAAYANARALLVEAFPPDGQYHG